MDSASSANPASATSAAAAARAGASAATVDASSVSFGAAAAGLPLQATAVGGTITLSVGGERFETSRATLLRVPDTFFTGLLSGVFALAADGIFCIDRSPRVFGLVLEYLRHGICDMFWPSANWADEDTLLQVCADARFYSLLELEDFVVRICMLQGLGSYAEPLDYSSRKCFRTESPYGDEYATEADFNRWRPFLPFVDKEDTLKTRVQISNVSGDYDYSIFAGRVWCRRVFPHFPVRLARQYSNKVAFAVFSYAGMSGAADAQWRMLSPSDAAGFVTEPAGRRSVRRLFEEAERLRRELTAPLPAGKA